MNLCSQPDCQRCITERDKIIEVLTRLARDLERATNDEDHYNAYEDYAVLSRARSIVETRLKVLEAQQKKARTHDAHPG